MVSNQNEVIHSRLWCVYEAFCAQQLHIPSKVAGDPLWLVAQEKREDVKTALHKIKSGEVDGREVESLVAKMDIDVQKAKCFSEDDKKQIWHEIGPHARAVNLMVKGLIVEKVLTSDTGTVALRLAGF